MWLGQQHDLSEEEESVKAVQLPVEIVGMKHLRAAVSLFLTIKCFYWLVVEVNTFTDLN